MKHLKIIVPVVLLIVVVVGVVVPIGPKPGTMIGGTEMPAPATWPDTSDVHEIRLAVPGTLPRVVVIWLVEHNSEIYVAGSRDSGWVKMLGAGGPVKMRLGDNTYPLVAEAVTENLEPVLYDYMAKYREDYADLVDTFPDPAEAADMYGVFRLNRP